MKFVKSFLIEKRENVDKEWKSYVYFVVLDDKTMSKKSNKSLMSGHFDKLFIPTKSIENSTIRITFYCDKVDNSHILDTSNNKPSCIKQVVYFK